MASEEIIELIKGRSSPGVLILDFDNRLLYSNPEALVVLGDSNEMPVEVQRLCERVRSDAAESGKGAGHNCELFVREGQPPFSLRAFLIGGQDGDRKTARIMVLIEKVTEHHALNLNKAKTRFGLSNREIEIVALVGRGLANKEIGGKLFISEHTVKDHLKNIMRKMSAACRSEIIALLQ